MEGRVSPGPWCKEQLAHGCYATAHWPAGLEPTTSRSLVESSALTTRLPRHIYVRYQVNRTNVIPWPDLAGGGPGAQPRAKVAPPQKKKIPCKRNVKFGHISGKYRVPLPPARRSGSGKQCKLSISSPSRVRARAPENLDF